MYIYVLFHFSAFGGFPGCWRSALVETVFSWSTSLVWISWTPSLVAYCLAGQQCLSIHRYPLKCPAFKSLQPSKQIAVRRPNFLMFNRSNWATVLCIKMHISDFPSPFLPSESIRVTCALEDAWGWKCDKVWTWQFQILRGIFLLAPSCSSFYGRLPWPAPNIGGRPLLLSMLIGLKSLGRWRATWIFGAQINEDSAGIYEVFFGTNCFFLISSWLLPCFSAFCTVLGFIYFLALCFCTFLFLFFLFFFVGRFFGFFSAC